MRGTTSTRTPYFLAATNVIAGNVRTGSRVTRLYGTAAPVRLSTTNSDSCSVSWHLSVYVCIYLLYVYRYIHKFRQLFSSMNYVVDISVYKYVCTYIYRILVPNLSDGCSENTFFFLQVSGAARGVNDHHCCRLPFCVVMLPDSELLVLCFPWVLYSDPMPPDEWLFVITGLCSHQPPG